jgi:hypothetical protein
MPELSRYHVSEVNIGDCIGNPIGFQGREIWLLEAYESSALELMALEKISGIYKSGNKTISNIIDNSAERFTKLIDYNSKFMDYKNLLDKAEARIEKAQMGLDNEGSQNEFNINGLLMKCYSSLVNQSYNFSRIIATPDIENGRFNTFNYVLLFNDIIEDTEMRLPKDCRKIYISGYVINKEWKNIGVKVETNSNFEMMINNFVIFKKDNIEGTISANSEIIKLSLHSLNRIQIVIYPKQNLVFKTSIITDNNTFVTNKSNFIPFKPFEEFKVNRNDLNDYQLIPCSTTNFEGQLGLCSGGCTEAKTINICKDSYEKGLILNHGGLISKHKLNNSLIGLDYLITEVKLGHFSEYNMLEKESKEQLKQSFIFGTNGEGSFLYYKKQINPTSHDVLIDIKLACDNVSTMNDYIPTDSLYRVEKLHDMINGFTITLVKMNYNDYIAKSSQYFISNIDLAVYSNQTIADTNSRNRLICSQGVKKIVLEYTYSRISYTNNTPNYNSDLQATADPVKFLPEQDKGSKVNCKSDLNEIGLKSKEAGILSENFTRWDDNSMLNRLPILEVNTNSNYRVYESDIDLAGVVNQGTFSSFLQISQFYSNDLLTKLEKGLNTVTDKILEQSQKIVDVEK